MNSSSDDTSPGRPLLRIVSGSPTPEEVAALVVVLTAAGRAGPSRQDAATSTWADRARAVRAPLQAGPYAWRASALPS